MPPKQAARDLEAGEAGHLDVEHHEVRAVLLDDSQRLDAVGRLAHDLDTAELPEQEAQLLARQLLVVHDNGRSVDGRPRLTR